MDSRTRSSLYATVLLVVWYLIGSYAYAILTIEKAGFYVPVDELIANGPRLLRVLAVLGVVALIYSFLTWVALVEHTVDSMLVLAGAVILSAAVASATIIVIQVVPGFSVFCILMVAPIFLVIGIADRPGAHRMALAAAPLTAPLLLLAIRTLPGAARPITDACMILEGIAASLGAFFALRLLLSHGAPHRFALPMTPD